ncbi:GntR family transcriptional regulator [Alteribacillus sp. HJP-4]|uniref:GntR family transcriptional regulator n=1 Tax=Alteribacillus sp. HJP-4 TaxID=2775394 RepID=UPI0035CD0CD6
MSNKLEEMRSFTVEQHVTESLRNAIFQGKFQRGDRLIQEEWAKKLGVSRMPVREAIKQLEMEGLVQTTPRKGAVVLPITADDVEEIYTLRAFNESLAVEKALPYIQNADIEELERILLEMEHFELHDENLEYYISLNKRYHAKMREKSSWRRVKQKVDMLWSGYLPIASPRLLRDQFEEAQREHRLIFEAIKKKDKELTTMMIRFHIERNKKSLLHIVETYNDITEYKG